MTQIVVFPRGQLTAHDKKALRAAGVVPVEADDPRSVVVVVPMAGFADVAPPTAMLMSALKAVADSRYPPIHDAFVVELYRRVRAAEAAAAPTEKPNAD